MSKKKKTPPAIGQQIRAARRAADLSQTELGVAVGLPHPQVSISAIECNAAHAKSWETIQAILRFLKIERHA